uniref:Alpha-adducin n=1 Tax=Schistocephalus solidus TaxID=70667 RepID=A0A0X3NXB4_SCHSO
MEQENLTGTIGDEPGAMPSINKNNADARYNSKSHGLLTDKLLADLNKGGALEQLSEFLTQHVKGDALRDFKGNTPTVPINDLRGEDAARYSREERLLRCQVASLCRLIDLNGWTQSIYNHLSARCATGEFLVNPFGLLYHEVQASTLVKVDETGNILDPGSTVLGANKAAWTLHSAIHGARPDIACVLHVHLPDVVAVSCIRSGLLPTSPEATELLNTFGVKYHDYQAITIDESEAGAIREALGKSKVLFLRNRGVAIAASTIPEAWYLVKLVVTACQTQMRLLQLGGNAALLTELTEDSAALAASGGSVLISARPFDGAVEQEEEKNEVEEAEAQHTKHEQEQERDDKEHPHTTDPSSSAAGICNGGPRSTSSGAEVVWGVGDMEFEAQMRMLDSAGFRTGYVYRNPNLLRRQPTSMPWSGNSGTVTDFFTTDFSCGEISGVDDVTAANTAGAVQKAKIADHVRVNKERGSQRNQFLSNTSAVVPSPTIQLPVSREPQSQSTPQFCSDNLPLDRLTLNGHGDDKDLTQPPQPDLSSTTSTPKKKGTVVNGIDEPRTPPTERANVSSRSASLPHSAHNKVNTLPARTSNTLETVDGIVSDDEHLATGKKPKNKWGSFRFPNFNKKKKYAAAV